MVIKPLPVLRFSRVTQGRRSADSSMGQVRPERAAKVTWRDSSGVLGIPVVDRYPSRQWKTGALPNEKTIAGPRHGGEKPMVNSYREKFVK